MKVMKISVQVSIYTDDIEANNEVKKCHNYFVCKNTVCPTMELPREEKSSI